MGSMLRSDLMSFCDIYIQPEAAFEMFSRIGEMSCVNFIDMTPDTSSFQRNFLTELCRCVELERKLRYIESEMKKDQIYVPGMATEPPALSPHALSQYENMLENYEEELQVTSANQVKLAKSYLELLECQYVLQRIGPMLGNVDLKKAVGTPYLGVGGSLFVTTGVVSRARSFPFQVMLFRISRGNIFYREAPEDQAFEDPATGQQVRKVAFLAFCQGEQINVRMEKVCAGFRVNVYPCPTTGKERTDMLKNLHLRISDLDQVLKKTKYHRCKKMRSMGRHFHTWMTEVIKAKAIYNVMNLFTMDITRKCLIGNCWVPTTDVTRVQTVLDQCSKELGTNVPSFLTAVPTKQEPPTYNRTNKFTHGFQALVNAYGEAKYRELSPGLYTIITFPFLFAVMFGDMGHGLILFFFSAWMVIKEKKLSETRSTNEIWNVFFGGRYVMLLMGMFTIFTGFIYNDIFSKPMVLMKSKWTNQYTEAQIVGSEQLTLNPSGTTGSTYLLGVDPIWALSKNKIMSDNSLKMKLSVILGIAQMLFGIVLSFFNHITLQRKHAIVLEFIPQLLFLSCLFGYLVFMIFFKWFSYSAKDTNIKQQPGCAPLILLLFIDMALLRKSVSPEPDCDPYMYPNQRLIQMTLLGISLICVPVLLFGTPIYIYGSEKKKREEFKNIIIVKRKSRSIVDETAPHSFGDLMIHQMVHTIEFVLSTISHTASYLRLWALSLAHAQLSEMLWQMIFNRLALSDHSYIGSIKIFLIFAVWASFSIAILVVMEGLSAFLHTLRLHWVEFMSKFFVGGGTIFSPFSFKELLYGEGKEDRSSEAACKKETK